MYFLRSILPFWLLAAFYLGTASSRAADLNAISGLQVQNGVVTVEFADNAGFYNQRQHSNDSATWARAHMSPVRLTMDEHGMRNSPARSPAHRLVPEP